MNNWLAAAIFGGVVAFSFASNAIAAEGAVVKVENEGREITIDAGGTEIMSKISGSRTKVTINGQEGDRANIIVGMECITDVENSGDEATTFDCTN